MKKAGFSYSSFIFKSKLQHILHKKKGGEDTMKKLIGSLLGILTVLLVVVAVHAAGGFDQYGYNYTARLFNGTGESWSLAKGLPADYLGIYASDKLVMKWNAEWDRGNAENWANPPYGAWENNEWNGKVSGGSGQNWHYKIVWVGNYTADSSLLPAGSYGIWGQFAVIMDQGTDPNYGPGHLWFAHATPNGYGVTK